MRSIIATLRSESEHATKPATEAPAGVGSSQGPPPPRPQRRHSDGKKGEQTFCLASLQDRRPPSASPSPQEAPRPTGPITKVAFWVSLTYVDPSCSITRAVPRSRASQHPCDFLQLCRHPLAPSWRTSSLSFGKLRKRRLGRRRRGTHRVGNQGLGRQTPRKQRTSLQDSTATGRWDFGSII